MVVCEDWSPETIFQNTNWSSGCFWTSEGISGRGLQCEADYDTSIACSWRPRTRSRYWVVAVDADSCSWICRLRGLHVSQWLHSCLHQCSSWSCRRCHENCFFVGRAVDLRRKLDSKFCNRTGIWTVVVYTPSAENRSKQTWQWVFPLFKEKTQS